jgi:hypothetical protein
MKCLLKATQPNMHLTVLRTRVSGAICKKWLWKEQFFELKRPASDVTVRWQLPSCKTRAAAEQADEPDLAVF